MRGHLDKCSIDVLSGWVFNSAQPNDTFEVKIDLDGKMIASTTANLPRPDLLKVSKGHGKYGFRFSNLDKKGLSKSDLPKLEFSVRGPNGDWATFTPGNHGKRGAGQYQSFDDATGVSKSSEKLKALRLSKLPNRHSKETPLKGLSVLDIGCNEGYFSGQALSQGAKRVLGIDASASFIERAQDRFPAAEFKVGSWWGLPEEKFDVIFFLSAIHYEPEQRRLLDKLAQHLTPTGVLVLECGIGSTPGKSWEAVKRWDGVRVYPTHDLLTQDLLANYAPSLAGQSVIQSGDPVPRFVYHCGLKQTSVLVFAGGYESGAASPLNDLARQGSDVFNVDDLLARIVSAERYDWTELKVVVEKAGAATEGDPFEIAEALISADKANDLADLIVMEAPTYGCVTVIEGEVLRHPALHAAVLAALNTAGMNAWGVIRP
jgi:SAM-dependent methyltransferase